MADRVVVFGGSGFIGSHVADALTAEGYDVAIFDRESSPYLREGQAMVQGDLLDREQVGDAVKGARYVFHFAGISDIGESTRFPRKTMEVNVMGTSTVLEACVKARVERFIFASSMYVYCDLGSFYRVSKQACEKLIEEYSREFLLGYTILRIGTPYGPRANHFNSIRRMLNQAFYDKKIVHEGIPDDIRDYIHVFDAAKEAVTVLEPAYVNKHVIVTGHQTVPLGRLTTLIREMMPGDIEIEYKPRKETHHYHLTPYAFKPANAIKLIPQTYHDLGQGLLELMYELEGPFRGGGGARA